MSSPDYTASELAERFDLTVHGDGSVRVQGVATLAAAGQGQLAFLANPRYRKQLADSHASIVVLRADDAAAAPHTALIAKDPYTTFAKIGALFETVPVREPGCAMVSNTSGMSSVWKARVRLPSSVSGCQSSW